MTVSDNQTDSRQALVKRIESREVDIGTYLQRARRRRDRFSLVSMGSGAVVDLAGPLELYGRQSTSAWASRVVTGHRRAVPDAPEPADPTDWPHSEVERFHHTLALCAAAATELIITGESQ
ncbi:hypothetical protein AB0D57_43625 [Streptomyces sp. NPDC048275]|uniref:hypothetical protein n=1 Tax=Streptomyces sp. NPDC048275 TaxID=3155629 RepID=UPI00340FF49C